MKRQLKAVSLIMCMIMTLCFFASCALYKDDVKKSDDTNTTIMSGMDDVRAKFSDKDLEKPVITIGKRTVSLAEYLDFFEEIYTYYKSNYSVDILESNETLTQYIDLITESLTKDTMIMYKADELGLSELSDEQKAEIKANYDKEVEDMYEYYTDYLEADDTISDEAELKEQIDKYILDEAEYYCGEGTTIEEYLDYLYEKEEEKYIQNLLFEEVTKDVKVSDEDLKSWYDEHVDQDAEYFKEHPESYKDECDSYELTGYISDGKTPIAPLYVPEGYGRMLHIVIKSTTTVSDKYKDNADKMAKLEEEYGKLAFENAMYGETESNNDRMAAILEEYNNLKKENEAELSEVYKDAKAKADEAYSKLEAGEDFAKVMEEYTEDSSFQKGGAFAKKGRLISTKYTSDDDWSAEVKKEYGKTKKGTYSQVFLDDEGYHIIYHISNEKQGKRTFEQAKAEIDSYLIDTEKQNAYNELMETWTDDKSIVIVDNELIEKMCYKTGK